MSNNTNCDIILALDANNREEVFSILEKAGPKLKWVKVGLQLFTLYGPDIVKELADKDYKVFLDLKLHDIPNTVSSAIRSLKSLPIKLLTIHAAGGPEMIKWSLEAAQGFPAHPTLLAVTVLTSMDQIYLNAIGVPGAPQDQVLRLVKMGTQAGLNGFVCSPIELHLLREEFGPSLTLVTPGIRPAGSNANEQKRIMTPTQAVQKGASYIVVGRPISQAEDPAQAVSNILDEINLKSINHG